MKSRICIAGDGKTLTDFKPRGGKDLYFRKIFLSVLQMMDEKGVGRKAEV